MMAKISIIFSFVLGIFSYGNLVSASDLETRIGELEESVTKLLAHVTKDAEERHENRLVSLEGNVHDLHHLVERLVKRQKMCCHGEGNVNPHHGRFGHQHEGGKNQAEDESAEHHQLHHNSYSHDDNDTHHVKYHLKSGHEHGDHHANKNTSENHHRKYHGHGHGSHHSSPHKHHNHSAHHSGQRQPHKRGPNYAETESTEHHQLHHNSYLHLDNDTHHMQYHVKSGHGHGDHHTNRNESDYHHFRYHSHSRGSHHSGQYARQRHSTHQNKNAGGHGRGPYSKFSSIRSSASLPAKFKAYGNSYNLAECDMQPNSNSTINGEIYMRQHKISGPLEILLLLKGFNPDMGHYHAFDVHEFGNIDNGCNSMGGHLLRQRGNSSVGQFENIHCDEFGNVEIQMEDRRTHLKGKNSIMGKGLAIHKSMSSEDNEILACCVIREKIL